MYIYRMSTMSSVLFGIIEIKIKNDYIYKRFTCSRNICLFHYLASALNKELQVLY